MSSCSFLLSKVSDFKKKGIPTTGDPFVEGKGREPIKQVVGFSLTFQFAFHRYKKPPAAAIRQNFLRLFLFSSSFYFVLFVPRSKWSSLIPGDSDRWWSVGNSDAFCSRVLRVGRCFFLFPPPLPPPPPNGEWCIQSGGEVSFKCVKLSDRNFPFNFAFSLNSRKGQHNNFPSNELIPFLRKDTDSVKINFNNLMTVF